LDPRVQELIKILFDQKEIDRSIVDLGVDVRRIGQITQQSIKDAYGILKALEGQLQPSPVQTKQQHEAELTRISNNFYNLIPHRSGNTTIKTPEQIREKAQLLEALTDIEIANRLLREKGTSDLNMSPIDINYRKLRAEIVPLEKYRAEYQLIEQIVQNTQSDEFKFQIELDEAFEITREGEADRFSPFVNLPHHRLLWHGSRLSNYIGIISQGLRIAPAEAPVTGYFLGKGIYFADMVSVSGQYCHTSNEHPTGLMLLCDTALGRTFQIAHGKFIGKEDLDGAGFHSVKCSGTKGPDQGYDTQTNEGLIVSLGREAPTGVPVSELVHNEIVVYDPAQVRMKYLLKMRFTHNK
jgi:poly [ADP-ribose] polymerase